MINRRVTTDADPNFLLEYTNITIANPTHVMNYDKNTNTSLLFP